MLSTASGFKGAAAASSPPSAEAAEPPASSTPPLRLRAPLLRLRTPLLQLRTPLLRLRLGARRSPSAPSAPRPWLSCTAALPCPSCSLPSAPGASRSDALSPSVSFCASPAARGRTLALLPMPAPTASPLAGMTPYWPLVLSDLRICCACIWWNARSCSAFGRARGMGRGGLRSDDSPLPAAPALGAPACCALAAPADAAAGTLRK
mmetsp:Transcript_3619/g.14661  ORF Transcript_3619/g.14661 Transcript_3619/m.14661 type:complete len:206 (-) Transcript_3619:259-876(-)